MYGYTIDDARRSEIYVKQFNWLGVSSDPGFKIFALPYLISKTKEMKRVSLPLYHVCVRAILCLSTWLRPGYLGEPSWSWVEMI